MELIDSFEALSRIMNDEASNNEPQKCRNTVPTSLTK